jgi:hypothetical protein
MRAATTFAARAHKHNEKVALGKVLTKYTTPIFHPSRLTASAGIKAPALAVYQHSQIANYPTTCTDFL